jgi:acetaldehyde dehydrogenase
MHSPWLDLRLVVGRDAATPGLRQAERLGLPTSIHGITSLVNADDPFDIVFDATNAVSHAEHADKLLPLGAMLVDLTPSNFGHMVVPTVNGTDIPAHSDINMVSCGGQASIPILHAITRAHKIDYIEVVTTAATLSVGRGTRLNLDEYVQTTQDAIRGFTGVKDAKVILNISPARPPATFRVAMSLLGEDLTDESVHATVAAAASELRSFIGGFEVTACTVEDGKAFVAVQVTSTGDHIPEYAGNLDIIGAAALEVAERYATDRHSTADVETS